MAWVSTLRHKTAPRICLDESFLLLFLYLNPYLLPTAPWHVWKLGVRGKVCPPAQEFGKRGGVFRILMPTAPTRTKLCPVVPGVTPTSFTVRALFGDVLTLPVQLRPPEMGILVAIGAVCRYWEGGNAKAFRISGREVKTAPAFPTGRAPACRGKLSSASSTV